MFYWKSPDKYLELGSSEMQSKEHLPNKQLQHPRKKKIQLYMKWLGNEGLSFMQKSSLEHEEENAEQV